MAKDTVGKKSGADASRRLPTEKIVALFVTTLMIIQKLESAAERPSRAGPGCQVA